MTSQELLLALADKDTLELARRMIGKPRLAFLLAKQAIGPEGETSLDAEAVAQILGVHKRHAYRLIKSATCQMKAPHRNRSAHWLMRTACVNVHGEISDAYAGRSQTTGEADPETCSDLR
jgi:hypothetical protein